MEIDLNQSYRLAEKKVRLPLKNYPVQLNVGQSRSDLHIYPERPINQPMRDIHAENYIIFDPNQYYKTISGFIRLSSGDKIILGKNQGNQKNLINLPQNLSTRHLSIENDAGKLIFKSIDEKHGACIAPLLKDKDLSRISKWRMAKLKRIGAIFGGKIERLPPDDAFKTIKQVNKLLESEAYRAKDSRGKPGGVVEIPAGMSTFLIGDLHTKIDNLLVVLSQNGFLEAMKKGRACLVILGDAVHNEEEGELEEMESSLLIMDFIFKLKIHFPNQVFYLRGNHDSFSEEIGKRGVPQGMLWERTLIAERGEAYKDEMARFYRRLPYVAYSKRFIACHAAPPVSSITLKKLININDNKPLMNELVNNRLRRPNKPAGYFKREIKKFRECFGVDKETPVIVGHTPMTDDATMWSDVGDIPNHHVIYASHKDWVGVMVQLGHKMLPLVYPAESLVPLINSLD
ncbi:MAG: metallophosphoesterase, partial [Sedimenticola sp.]